MCVCVCVCVCVHACSMGGGACVMCTCAGAVCMHGVYMLSACMHVLCVHVSERTCMYVCLHAHTSIFPPHQFTFLAACSACSWYLDFLPGKVRISSSSPSSSSCVVLHCSACQQFTQPLPHSTVVYTGYSLSHTSQHSTVVSPHRIRPLPHSSLHRLQPFQHIAAFHCG